MPKSVPIAENGSQPISLQNPMLLDLLDQGVVIALVVAGLGVLYLWRKHVAHVGTTKVTRGFNLVRALKRTDTELALLGNFKSDNHKKAAVLIIQSAAMDTGTLDQLMGRMSLHKVLVNDIYSSFLGDVSREVKPYKVRILRTVLSEDDVVTCHLLGTGSSL